MACNCDRCSILISDNKSVRLYTKSLLSRWKIKSYFVLTGIAINHRKNDDEWSVIREMFLIKTAIHWQLKKTTVVLCAIYRAFSDVTRQKRYVPFTACPLLQYFWRLQACNSCYLLLHSCICFSTFIIHVRGSTRMHAFRFLFWGDRHFLHTLLDITSLARQMTDGRTLLQQSNGNLNTYH